MPVGKKGKPCLLLLDYQFFLWIMNTITLQSMKNFLWEAVFVMFFMHNEYLLVS